LNFGSNNLAEVFFQKFRSDKQRETLLFSHFSIVGNPETETPKISIALKMAIKDFE